MSRVNLYTVLLLLVIVTGSCSYSKKFTAGYYKENETTLQSAKQRFNRLYKDRPFSLELKDKALTRIGLEILTDTIKYIYNFRLDQPFFLDTLQKYELDVKVISELISDMQLAHCTWITTLDYYENRVKKDLLFISVRHKKLEAFLKPEKYFTLAFFDDPQPADKKGRLLDKADQKTLRKINGEIFRRINERVFYALMEQFR